MLKLDIRMGTVKMSWNRLLAVTRIIIVMRNRRRYLKNRLMFGSECIYHIENSMMDQVTNSATGVKLSLIHI